MNSILKKYNIHLGFLALVSLMLATRVHHFGSAFSLPDASLIVFFLSGLFFNRLKLFIFLLAEAALIDYVVISQFNVSDFCVSPAYAALIPAYGAMWLAGDYCAKFKKLNRSEMYAQFVVLFLATTTAFLISNGSFFLFSGKTGEISLAHYLQGVNAYYPPYVSATLIYGLVIGAGIKIFRSINAQTEESANLMH
jgi:hypothetical protein